VSVAATELKPNDRCWCGSGRKFKQCHKPSTERIRAGHRSPILTVPDSIAWPEYARTGVVERRPEGPRQPADIIDRMRRSCVAAADVLVEVGAAVAPGITTDELDRLCHEAVLARDAYPSPLTYGGPDNPFPKSLCTSVNEVICHGIPDDRPLRDGDIVNLDVTIFREGVHGDTNATFFVGDVDPESARLVRTTRDCLARAIEAIAPGRPLNVIGRAIQEHAEGNGFGVVRDFIGHGIGEQFHTGFSVPHYFDPRADTILEPGMVFTIEPMITAGSWQARMWPDGWTAVTADQRRSAQFEHTLLVTEAGGEILTVPTEPSRHPYWVLSGS
jgi:methionyl aminopeptidase